MKRRPLGATGITVSEIGLGAWQLANTDWGVYDRAEALRVVQQALDAGCDFFDTAPPYGGGRSETLLGRALGGVRPSVTICTKFGHSAEFPPTNFDVAALRPSLEGSLRRLRTDYVDVLLLHSPPVALLNGRHAPHYEEMERLKAEGKLRVYGVSLGNSRDLKTVLETTRSGAIEVTFNVFHQEPRAAFRYAQEQGVGLIANVPLDSGWLSGKYRGDSGFTGVRRRWSPDVISRRARLVEQVAALVPPGISLVHAALRYVLAQPEVSTVIPGAKTVAQVRENAAAGDGQLPDDVVRALDALWECELRDHPLPW
jgi:aryl-alcohol dehydrogenase-like predicted oxidoreductase